MNIQWVFPFSIYVSTWCVRWSFYWNVSSIYNSNTLQKSVFFLKKPTTFCNFFFSYWKLYKLWCQIYVNSFRKPINYLTNCAFDNTKSIGCLSYATLICKIIKNNCYLFFGIDRLTQFVLYFSLCKVAVRRTKYKTILLTF